MYPEGCWRSAHGYSLDGKVKHVPRRVSGTPNCKADWKAGAQGSTCLLAQLPAPTPRLHLLGRWDVLEKYTPPLDTSADISCSR